MTPFTVFPYEITSANDDKFNTELRLQTWQISGEMFNTLLRMVHTLQSLEQRLKSLKEGQQQGIDRTALDTLLTILQDNTTELLEGMKETNEASSKTTTPDPLVRANVVDDKTI